MKRKNELIDALCQEISFRKNYFKQPTILQSIYFGGGTPSLLTTTEIEQLLETIAQYFSIEPTAEITLEANPDDIHLQNLKSWRNVGINRLSVGVQTFQPHLLAQLNRVHTSVQAQAAIPMIQEAGFENFSIDLMYGLPQMTIKDLEQDLATLLGFEPPHVSIYGLTIEPQTTFGNWSKKGKLQLPPEEKVAQQFEKIMDTLLQEGYEQYEISNFAKNLQYAKHNLSYWQDSTYLGIGPSAHSYDGENRHYAISNNALYLKKIQSQELPLITDILDQNAKINEYLLTSLRTQWGCDMRKIQEKFGVNLWLKYSKLLEQYQQEGLLNIIEEQLYLTRRGKLLADEIIANIFFM